MQQSYAKVPEIVERVILSNVVEDALQMSAVGPARSDIETNRDFREIPPAFIDKQKLLPILINLFRNAKYALEAARHSKKTLNLGIRLNERGMIEIRVADNGIGIARENLPRLFSSGFSTKREGHGFGLHSAALAATELGGSLRGQSEGEGKGATFVLELPITMRDSPGDSGRRGGK